MPDQDGRGRSKFNRAIALHRQGKLADAERAYREVLRLKPNHFDALHLLGVLTLQTRGAEAGIELIRKAIALKPNVAAAHNNLGVALDALGRPEEALASFERAIALKPDMPDTQNMRGNMLMHLKRPKEALASYDQAIRLKPDYAEAHNNRGVALRALRRIAESLVSCEQAIAFKPGYAEAHYNRGVALTDLRRPAEALASYERALTLKPAFPKAHNNKGVALMDLNRPEEALASYDTAITLKSDYAEAYNNRGNVLRDLGRPEEALASYDKAIRLKPDYADAHLNQGLCLLLMGDFEQGLRQYEWRKKGDEPIAFHSYPRPQWLGKESITDKTVFIYWEQGFGDTIQFCRYAKLLEAHGAKVIMSVQDPLHGLLSRISPTIRILESHEEPTDFDCHCSLLSLPLALGTTLQTIPSEGPYINADKELRALWSTRLPRKTKPRIGVAWSGNAAYRYDHIRSMELKQFLPIFDPGADWVCLQKDIREADADMLAQLGCVAQFGDDLRDFNDTAALLDLMDLVITTDTSVAHLAGAMGKPVWILLSYNRDWRWLMDRDDSPWYPSARLFRQQQIGNWAEVIEQVKRELRRAILRPS